MRHRDWINMDFPTHLSVQHTIFFRKGFLTGWDLLAVGYKCILQLAGSISIGFHRFRVPRCHSRLHLYPGRMAVCADLLAILPVCSRGTRPHKYIEAAWSRSSPSPKACDVGYGYVRQENYCHRGRLRLRSSGSSHKVRTFLRCWRPGMRQNNEIVRPIRPYSDL